ncbi:MAG: DUF374 domain-containing protein [Deltaproteobacteria bacterium]|nr:MAG: DUF374 domain-containing protein [Deltaproteobacteria bacterium]
MATRAGSRSGRTSARERGRPALRRAAAVRASTGQAPDRAWNSRTPRPYSALPGWGFPPARTSGARWCGAWTSVRGGTSPAGARRSTPSASTTRSRGASSPARASSAARAAGASHRAQARASSGSRRRGDATGPRVGGRTAMGRPLSTPWARGGSRAGFRSATGSAQARANRSAAPGRRATRPAGATTSTGSPVTSSRARHRSRSSTGGRASSSMKRPSTRCPGCMHAPRRWGRRPAAGTVAYLGYADGCVNTDPPTADPPAPGSSPSAGPRSSSRAPTEGLPDRVTTPAGGRWMPPVIAGGFSLLARSIRVQRFGFDAVARAYREGPLIFAFWHGEQLAYIANHRFWRVAGMASHSRDGELLARCIERLGYPAIRGSSSRGGRAAFAECLRRLEDGWSVGLAVDGPRGPRHRPHVGAVALAARVRRPVAWMVSRASPRLRLGSWDRFEIPLPLARWELVYGLFPVEAEPDDRDAVERARVALGETMAAASAALEAGVPAASVVSGPGSTPR